jgi:16S rRNA (uracil1498-N3)-methyltransferase
LLIGFVNVFHSILLIASSYHLGYFYLPAPGRYANLKKPNQMALLRYHAAVPVSRALAFKIFKRLLIQVLRLAGNFMKRFFIPAEQIGTHQTVLKGPEAHHARTVLRLRSGDEVVVFDGQGHEYQARICEMDNREVTLDILKPLEAKIESGLRLTLAQGYLKDQKMDRLVRQLTELGVARWVPFFAHRSVAVPDSQRLARRYQRWHKISMEAMKQCRRSHVMTIDPVLPFDQVMTMCPDYSLKWVFYENASTPANWDQVKGRSPSKMLIMIGPEGGFTEKEIALALEHGFSSIGLGPRILRAETAAVAACAIAQAVIGDMGGMAGVSEKCP